MILESMPEDRENILSAPHNTREAKVARDCQKLATIVNTIETAIGNADLVETNLRLQENNRNGSKELAAVKQQLNDMTIQNTKLMNFNLEWRAEVAAEKAKVKTLEAELEEAKAALIVESSYKTNYTCLKHEWDKINMLRPDMNGTTLDWIRKLVRNNKKFDEIKRITNA